MHARPNEARSRPNDVSAAVAITPPPAKITPPRQIRLIASALAETNTEALERCTGLAPGVTNLPIDQIRLNRPSDS